MVKIIIEHRSYDMKYIDFCDESLSRIVLGTDGYSERIDRETAFAIMDCYIENGGNVIDTARSYCGGKSEELIGSYLKERGIRNKIFISTKCSFPHIEDMTKSRLTPQEIEADIDASLLALGVDTIDMLWLHRDDERKGVRHMMDALNDMVQKGKIRNFGASNWTFERIDDANRYAYESGGDGFAAGQVHYNLATCTHVWDDTMVVMDSDEKAKYEANDFPVFAYSPQAKGFFEKYDRGILSVKAKERYLCEDTVKMYARIKAEAAKEGDTISYTALRLLCEDSSFDVFPVVGASNVSQLKDSLNIL